MINKMYIEMMPWRGFEFGDPIAEMFAHIVAFLRIVFTLVKTRLSRLILALEAKTLGRVAGRTQTRGNTVRLDGFGYNPRSELTSANLGTDSFAYSFDNIGNRINATEKNVSTNYTTNKLNQYQGGDFTYDFDGNQTRIKTDNGIWNVTYNGENRPIRFTKQSDSSYITMTYDYMGRRVEKASYSANGVLIKKEKFAYRGYLQVANYDCTTGTDSLQTIVYWNPTEPTATQPLAITDYTTGSFVYCTHDLTKNVCELITPAGNILTQYDYSPFGAVTALNVASGSGSGYVGGNSSPPYNAFQFSSEYFDAELDLVYYNYRHYNPTSGRFLSRDPIQENGGFNLYATCRNNVVMSYDVNGLFFDWLDTLPEKAGREGEKIQDAINDNLLFIKDLIQTNNQKILDALSNLLTPTNSCSRNGGNIQKAGCCCGPNIMDPKAYCCENGKIEKKIKLIRGRRNMWGKFLGPMVKYLGIQHVVFSTSENWEKRGNDNSGIYGKMPSGNPVWSQGIIKSEKHLDNSNKEKYSKDMYSGQREIWVCPKDMKLLTTNNRTDDIGIYTFFWPFSSSCGNCGGILW